MPVLLQSYNVRHRNRQGFNLDVAVSEVKPCSDFDGHDGGEFPPWHHSCLEHGRVYSHHSECVHRNATRTKLLTFKDVAHLTLTRFILGVTCTYLGLISVSMWISCLSRCAKRNSCCKTGDVPTLTEGEKMNSSVSACYGCLFCLQSLRYLASPHLEQFRQPQRRCTGWSPLGDQQQ